MAELDSMGLVNLSRWVLATDRLNFDLFDFNKNAFMISLSYFVAQQLCALEHVSLCHL